ncbi:MAG: phage major capsid protein [Gammaproteobacteria bacterium]|nr:phage major capsid protein [Gammaproteobacteria bacterium]
MSDLQEIKTLLDGQGKAWEEFRDANNARVASLEKDLVELMKRAGRPGAGAAGGLSFESNERKASFLEWMRGRKSDGEIKSMFSGSDPNGGFLVPSEVDDTLTKALRDLSPMRQLARVVQVSTSEYVMLHSTGGTGYAWAGETEARTEKATPSFTKITMTPAEVYTNLPISQVLLEDNAFDLESWLIEESAEVFDAAEGSAFISGDGVNKPRGLLSYPAVTADDSTRAFAELQYIASGAAGAFASTNPSDKLIDLVHSVRPRYRQGAAWLMNSSTLSSVRKFKETTGNFIWRAGLESAAPDTLLGYPVFTDENMPDVAADSLSIAFGNFMSGYTIVDRNTTLLRDPFTGRPNVLFYMRRRVTGGLRDSNAVKLMKFAAS